MVRMASWLLACSALVASSGDQSAQAVPLENATKVSFNGRDYYYRNSEFGYTFRPEGEKDWKDQITIDVHDSVGTGDRLAKLANFRLGNFKAGEAKGYHIKVIWTDAKPGTKDKEGEHLMAVVTESAGLFAEAAFIRFLLFEHKGVEVSYGHRVYGSNARDEMNEWLARNAPGVERALKSWAGMPSLSVLAGLPRAK